MEGLSSNKRVRDDSDESETDSPEVKRLREDLLENFDDSDLCTVSQDLDSFMKSFEEEITGSPTTAAEVLDLTGSGESQPELGYLLEASDDELGLPPSNGEGEGRKEHDLVSDSSELSELWRFEEQIPSYDSFEFGVGNDDGYNGGSGGEYVALDGLFDYSDLSFGGSDLLWRPETLPAQ